MVTSEQASGEPTAKRGGGRAADAAEPAGADSAAQRPASPSTDRALTVLETLIDAESALTLTSLAQRAGVPLATCASIVQTFEQRGYAVRRVVGRSHFWQPTLRLYALGAGLIRAIDPATVAQRHLRALSDELGLPAHLGVLEDASIVYVAKAATPGFIQFDTYIGKVAPFNLTALGRAIAARLDEGELAPLLAHLTPGSGPNASGTDPEAFRAVLAETRRRGYALEDEDEQADIACVAVAVFDAAEQPACSVGVTGFAREFTGDRLPDIGTAVARTAAAISHDLGSRDLGSDGGAEDALGAWDGHRAPID